MKKPPTPTLNAVVTTTPLLNPRMVNRLIGTTGVPPRRSSRSNNAKAANTGAEATSMPIIQAGQPCSLPCTSGKTTRNTAPADNATPGRSRRSGCSERDSGTQRNVANSRSRPIGRLISQELLPCPATVRSALR
jgi:hypothetical protein